jgi:carbon monoxide dehydrogenase subunit G
VADSVGYLTHRTLHPGVELTEVVDDKTYRGKISVQLGPVALAFAGVVKLEELDPVNHTARVKAHGADANDDGDAHASGSSLPATVPKCWCTPTSCSLAA